MTRREIAGGEGRPTLDQVKRAARRLYNGEWYDQRQIIPCSDARPVRHEDDQMNCRGTWIDVSVFVPDRDALDEP